MESTCTVWINDRLNQLEILLNYQFLMTLGNETRVNSTRVNDSTEMEYENTSWYKLLNHYITPEAHTFLRSSVKISAGLMDQSKMKQMGPLIFSLATGQRLNRPPADVYRRQVLKYKDGPRAARVNYSVLGLVNQFQKVLYLHADYLLIGDTASE